MAHFKPWHRFFSRIGFQLSGMTPFSFTIISPGPNDRILGPLEICIQIRGNPSRLSQVSLELPGYPARGVMDWPFCRFLLPPPETDHLDGMVCFQLPDQIVRLPIHLDFQINHPDCQELPYEFVAAKQTGMVMKRHHIYGSGPPSPEVHGEIFKEILDHGGDVILDVGCGIGPYTTALNKKGKRAFGLEINWDYVKMARENKVPVLHYDGEHIPFKTESFETVIAIEVLEHVEAWDRLLHEMLRVARKNILITTPNMDILSGMCKHHVVPWHLLEATHCNFFTPETWRHVIMNLPNVTGYVKTISPFYVNNELFDMQLFVNMVKETGF